MLVTYLLNEKLITFSFNSSIAEICLKNDCLGAVEHFYPQKKRNKIFPASHNIYYYF